MYVEFLARINEYIFTEKGECKLKKLREFNKFDCEAFFKDKDVRVMAHEPWNQYEDGKITKELGTKFKCVIASDKTKYKVDDLNQDLNDGEKFDVYVPFIQNQLKKFNK